MMRNCLCLRSWCAVYLLLLLCMGSGTSAAQSVEDDLSFDMPNRLQAYFEEMSATHADSTAHCETAKQQLRGMLGLHRALPRRGQLVAGKTESLLDVVLERVAFPGEGTLVVPTWIVRPQSKEPGKLPVRIVLDVWGANSQLADSSPSNPISVAKEGQLIVLPELRTFDSSFSTGTDNKKAQADAWERNGIVWGRPVAGMGVTDLEAVIDGLGARADADMERVTIVARGSGDLAAIALFAMVLDTRLREADLDFAQACYEKHNLMLVPRILLYGDIPFWAKQVTDRRVNLRNVPPE